MPNKDGIQIVKLLRKEGVSTPIIITTARDKTEEMTLGLDIGADDYITKPFVVDEVRARIQAVTRRYRGRNTSKINVGMLSFDESIRQVTVNGKKLMLQPKEVDILECMMQRHPASISIEDITDYVYADSYTYNSSVIRVHIAKLRKKVNEAVGFELLRNQRGRGYYLCEE